MTKKKHTDGAVVGTSRGQTVTEADIERMAAEADEGDDLSTPDFGLVRDGAVRQRVPAAWRARIAAIIRALDAGDHALDGVDRARHLEGSSPESVGAALRLAGGLNEPDGRTWERSEAMWVEWDGDEWWEVYVELDTVDPAGRDLVSISW